jgi:hypothetical protein
MAIDIRAVIDWPIPFLNNKSMRNFGDWELITLRKRQSR